MRALAVLGLVVVLASVARADEKPRVVVVGIDAKTLEKLGPWGGRYRPMHPRLMEQLEKAKVRGIGFDVFFPENPDFAAATAEIAKKAAASKAPVVIAANPEDGENAKVFKDAKIAEGTVTVRRALDVKRDGDSMEVAVTDLALPANVQGRRPLAIELALRAGVIKPEDVAKLTEPLIVGIEDGKPEVLQGIRPESGDPSKVTTVSYVDVLEGRVDPKILEGALVLVGMHDGKSDVHPHPKTGVETSGVYFHAFALERALKTATKKEPSASPQGKRKGMLQGLEEGLR